MKTVKIITKGTKSVNIVRMVKSGTDRVFFYPVTNNGLRLNRTNYARMYDAVSLGKVYLNN
jgi:hypothetical protein